MGWAWGWGSLVQIGIRSIREPLFIREASCASTSAKEHSALEAALATECVSGETQTWKPDPDGWVLSGSRHLKRSAVEALCGSEGLRAALHWRVVPGTAVSLLYLSTQHEASAPSTLDVSGAAALIKERGLPWNWYAQEHESNVVSFALSCPC